MTFTANAVATAGEVVTGYSWQMSVNGLGPFTTMGSGSSLVLTDVQTTNAGFYFVRVTYLSGGNQITLPSDSVRLIVLDQARIVSQPQSLNRLAGSNATFSIVARGLSPLSFQWRHNGTNLATNGRISGAEGANLGISDVMPADAGNYDVVVTNVYSAATSHIATLGVLVAPSVNIQPADSLVLTGSNATFSVVAAGGEPLIYRWMKGATPVSDGGRISGATSDTLVIAGALTNDNGSYSVSVSNNVGVTVSSNAVLTVVIPPVITSPANAAGRQGHSFAYTISASGTPPITFGSTGLPTGLTVQPTNGLISGVSSVAGIFDVTLFATNLGITTTGTLTLAMASDVPGINSPLTAAGIQGHAFNYSITASNDPAWFTTSALPPGLVFDAATGIVSGYPLVSGSFPILIGAANIYGADSQELTLNLVSGAPVITSSLSATGTENQGNFAYLISATNSPAWFGAIGLPLGLTVNTNTGVISGTPLYGGLFDVVITAANLWGTDTRVLHLNLNYAPLNDLSIEDVAATYSKPYLLDFSFSLRDNSDPTASVPIVRPPDQLQVTCFEDGNPVGTETAIVLEAGDKKQLKSFLVLDYSFSLFISPGAIDSMEAAAMTLVAEEPATAQFGVYEFHADYVDPELVTGFSADKNFLSQTIGGIRDNYVQDNYAGTRAFDATYAALQQFGPATNRDEQRYVVVMTDGNDDSSLLNTNDSPIDVLVALAQTNQVRIFCVAYGANINLPALQQLTSQTGGRYYEAALTADLPAQFLKIVKDIDGQYLLRWATLKRGNKVFRPSFQIAVDGLTNLFTPGVGSPSEYFYTNDFPNTVPPALGSPPYFYFTNSFDTNFPPDTNIVTVTNIIVVSTNWSPPNYVVTNWEGDVRAGSLRLVADADVGPQTIRLRATYVPRFVREIRIHYRANYSCAVNLDSTGAGDILDGWSLTQTDDGLGGQWLTLQSPATNNLLTSIPYGAFGDLLTFRFQYPEGLTGQAAFSQFTVDNSVYTNMPPTGQSFVIENTNLFITTYEPPPPHGTPIPWLLAYGITNGFETAELSDLNGNGLAVWQDYLAGLDPLDPSSRFSVQVFKPDLTGQPEVTFNTVNGRTYRVEWSADLSNWLVLQDDVSGTGGDVTVTDSRNLSGVGALFYRVSVH